MIRKFLGLLLWLGLTGCVVGPSKEVVLHPKPSSNVKPDEVVVITNPPWPERTFNWLVFVQNDRRRSNSLKRYFYLNKFAIEEVYQKSNHTFDYYLVWFGDSQLFVDYGQGGPIFEDRCWGEKRFFLYTRRASGDYAEAYQNFLFLEAKAPNPKPIKPRNFSQALKRDWPRNGQVVFR